MFTGTFYLDSHPAEDKLQLHGNEGVIMEAEHLNPKRVARRKADAIDIYMVASRAKVSLSTVSRTINHLPTVNIKLANRVWKAIHELGYTPNLQARELVCGRSGILGLIVPQITDPPMPDLIQSFEDAAADFGYSVLISSSYADASRMALCMRRIIERNSEAIAVMVFDIDDDLAKPLCQCAIPLVWIESGCQALSGTRLTVDYSIGIRQGVRHLAALGHRNIGFVYGPERLYSVQTCLAAFATSLDELGIVLEQGWIIAGDHSEQGGHRAMEQLLASARCPSAIICSNDAIAAGVVRAVINSGLRVPETISVIGLGDTPLARRALPPLTSIQIPPEEVARAAVSAMRSQVAGEASGREVRIATHLVVRQSTAPAISSNDKNRYQSGPNTT
jgi:LacI family transcriptional regulator